MDKALDFLYDIDYVEKHLFSFFVSTQYSTNKVIRIEVSKSRDVIFTWYVDLPSSLADVHHKITRAEYEYVIIIIANCLEQEVEEVKSVFTYD